MKTNCCKIKVLIGCRINALFLVLSVFSFSACTHSPTRQDEEASKVKILVLATDHFIPDSSKHEAEYMLAKLIEYKPDLVATEFTPYYDTLSLSKWETNFYKAVLDEREKEAITTTVILDSISYYHALSEQADSAGRDDHDNLIEGKAKLARFYYLLGDLSNFHYYVYQLSNLQPNLSKPQSDQVMAIVKAPLYKQAIEKIKRNEYGNIVFPLALSQSLKETIAVDHQARADSFVYWQLYHYDRLIEKYTKPVYDSLIQASEAQKQAKNPLTMISMNTHQYIEEHPDFYWPIPGLEFDSLSVVKTLEPWDYRNELAIKRLDDAIQSRDSKRAIITFGAMHAPPFIEILKNYPQYEVLLLEDL